MWHGDVGHWVVNDTPGMHGNDRFSSVMGDFVCPFDVTEWEGESAVNDFEVISAPCCDQVTWIQNGAETMTFEITDRINEEYPVYESLDADGNTIFMWWMWHDTKGHWVTNK